MRFIHMADVHLGAVPDSGCPWSAFRENEIWETFVRVIDQIREEKIELLLIAGDLFHRQPLPSQIERVSQLFASIPDTEVVWMAGSHDYLREDSAYRKAKWTKNVHGFLSGKPEVIELEKLHTKVYGCSYEQPEITEPVYSTIRPDDQPGIHILLAYGGDETHIPMKKEDGAGFTYVALGYRHLPGVLVENQMAYAGSPEPIRLEDAGTHGVVYGEITEDAQCVSFLYSAVLTDPFRHDTDRSGTESTGCDSAEGKRRDLLASDPGIPEPGTGISAGASEGLWKCCKNHRRNTSLLRSHPSETGKTGNAGGCIYPLV